MSDADDFLALALSLDPANDWCQRWRDRQHSWRHRSEGGFNKADYDVAPIEETSARAFVEANHYSGTYPAAVKRYGLYAGPFLVGVSVLSVPAHKRVLTSVFPELEPYDESLELGRFVLADSVPANGESWFLARCWELAARDGVRGVVSFSDPVPRTDREGGVVFPGHIGTIYQAANAAYLGRTTAAQLRLLPDGRVLSKRALEKVRAEHVGHAYVERMLVGFGAVPRRAGESGAGWLCHALREAGVRIIRHTGNHRYAFRLGAQRKLIALGLAAGNYPKKEAA